MRTAQTIFIILAIISFIFAGIMVIQGMDKINNYYNDEDLSFLNENAYVGGDAYNYIINANYAIGYYVLSLIFVVSGFSFILASYLTQLGGIVSGISRLEVILSQKSITGEKTPLPEFFSDLPKL